VFPICAPSTAGSQARGRSHRTRAQALVILIRVMHTTAVEWVDVTQVGGLEYNPMHYSPRCFFGPWGRGGTLVHTGSRTFQSWMAGRRSSHALNEIYRGARCATHNDHRHRFHGWHLSYAMTTSGIRRKLKSFSHAKDGFVRIALRRNDSYFDAQAANCFDLFNRAGERGVCIDKYLPPLIGWPAHPHGARKCDRTVSY